MTVLRSTEKLSGNGFEVDLAGFDTLYHQYHHAVYANICKMVSLPEVAEDILQEVFLALWENRQALDPEKVAGWLFVVSYNKSLSWHRKKSREMAVALPAALEETFVQEEQTCERDFQLKWLMIEEAFQYLPARKKEVFRLCRFEGRSPDEVADLLGISVMSVRDYLKQSTRFIKDYIGRNPVAPGLTAMSLLVMYLS